MATITVTRNTAVYTPPKKSTPTAKKPVRKAVQKPESKATKPETKKRTENQKAEQKSAANHRMWYAFDASKLQNELLKMAAKHDTKHSNMEFGYEIRGDKIAVTNSYAVWFIPKGNWYLNIETVFRGKSPFHLDTVVEDRHNAEPIELTAEIRKTKGLALEGGKDGPDVRIFKNPKSGEEIWINTEFLKLYDLERLQFEGSGKINPIYIYDSGELTGIVLPINH